MTVGINTAPTPEPATSSLPAWAKSLPSQLQKKVEDFQDHAREFVNQSKQQLHNFEASHQALLHKNPALFRERIAAFEKSHQEKLQDFRGQLLDLMKDYQANHEPLPAQSGGTPQPAQSVNATA